MALCGCTQHEIEMHPEAFNRAIGSLDTRLLLLNAVRASKNYPLEFTSVSTVLGGAKFTAELDPSLPFPFSPSRSYDPGIKAYHERSISSLAIANLNTAEALGGLKRSLGWSDFRYYQLSGWPEGVFRTLAFEAIRIHRDVYTRISAMADKNCSEDPTTAYCRMRTYSLAFCDGDRVRATRVLDQPILRFTNSGESTCEYAMFQEVLATLIPGGCIFLTKPTEKTEVIEVAGKTKTASKHSVEVFIESPDKHVVRMIHEYDRLLAPKGLAGLQVIYRSPERMVRFFGQLVRLQNFVNTEFVPKTVADNEIVDLVVVKRGSGFSADAAVSVRDTEGEWFFVPKPDYGAKGRQRTLQSMALIVDVLNSAVSKSDIPQVQTLTLSSP